MKKNWRKKKHSRKCEKKDKQLTKRTKKQKKMRNQQQRKTYYAKQTVKPREPPIYNAEMLKKNKTQQTTFNGRKKYKNGHQQ